MANISMNSFNESKQYDKVIYQQGQPITDYDLNEAQDIQRSRIRKLVTELIGDGAVGTGWQIVGTGATNNFTVKAGAFYRNGYRVNLAADSTATALGLTLTTPAGARTDKVYLKVYEVEIDSVADSAIRHTKLASTGLEPTRRIKIKADLGIAEGGNVPADTATEFYVLLATIARTAVATISAGIVTDNRTQAGIGPSISSHKTAATLDHPDNSVIDAKIGNRTITDTTAASADSGTLTAMLSMLGHMIKTITGKTSWRTDPATTLEAANTHYSTTTGVHGVGASTVESASGAQTKANTAETNAKTYADGILSTHKSASTLDHPDSSVTDAKIGNRIATPATAPTTNGPGTLTSWLSWITNRIIAITGKTNWYDSPSATLESLNTNKITNAGLTPSIQAGLKVNRPATGVVGRIYIATDTKEMFRDNGAGWDPLGITTVTWDMITSKPDNFTPATHAASHAKGGSDAVTPSAIGAVDTNGDTMNGGLSFSASGATNKFTIQFNSVTKSLDISYQ